MTYLLIPIISLVLLSIFLFLLFIIERKKYEQLRNTNYEQLKKNFTETHKTEIEKEKREIRALEDQKTKIQSEIEEKRKFNGSLLKIREEELDRLIAEKKKEKEKVLEAEINNDYMRVRAQYNKEFLDWCQQKEVEKEEYLNNYTKFQLDCQVQLDEIKKELNDFQQKRESINEAILRERQIAEAEDFYRIDVPKEDQEDIEVLNSIASRLRNKEALNKLIYSVFIQRPMDEMIKRITGGRDISGIYKITYLKTGEAYVGKSVNIKKRWGEHVKSSLDIGTIAHSSFHNRLKKDGLWNYTFEILEEVPKDQLTEREKFYIQLYKTDTQLNMKVG